MNWNHLNNRAYTPYSGTPKAAIVKGSSGNYYAGVRIENVSFPLTITAIQTACCICLAESDTPVSLIIEDKHYDQLSFWEKEFNLDVQVSPLFPDINLKDLLLPTVADLEQKLITLLDQAICPNSNFPVSALLEVDGGFFEGANVEVSEWAYGLCAERIAISKAIAAGFKQFKSISVHTKYGGISSPCGACRQVIYEHLPFNKLRMFHADGSLSEQMTVDMLPFSFKSNILKK